MGLKLIKLAEYVALRLAREGVSHIFGVSGGASLHLLHAVKQNPDLTLICPHHEQAAAMAADGYSRSTNNLGVAIATSGPGATNLITGICCSYYDSVPVIFFTGQVSTFRQVGLLGVRQVGFQETPITEMVAPIVKYSVKVTDPKHIKYEMEKAIYIAKNGRPGPVLIDIPDDIQRVMVDPSELEGFAIPKPEKLEMHYGPQDLIADLKLSSRPVIVAGWGLHLANVKKEFRQFVEKLKIPVVSTWGASNIISPDSAYNLGTFGTHGVRSANLAIQNSDLIISLGSRLDTKATGSPVSTFARNAKKIVIDIDAFELEKFKHFGLDIDVKINNDLRTFFSIYLDDEIVYPINERSQWFERITKWKELDSQFDEPHRQVCKINPYDFFEKFSKGIKENSKIFIDTGCSVAWLMQSGKFSIDHEIFHDYNNTAMGWALPASIGSFVRFSHIPHYCIVGDGAFMMSMQELATVQHQKLPLNLIIVNNSGYSMIKQTQEQWLGADYVASNERDLTFPSFKSVAESFGFDYFKIDSVSDLDAALDVMATSSGPKLFELIISSEARVIPQVKAGRPNEDMDPLLPRETFLDAMIIDHLDSSDG